MEDSLFCIQFFSCASSGVERGQVSELDGVFFFVDLGFSLCLDLEDNNQKWQEWREDGQVRDPLARLLIRK